MHTIWLVGHKGTSAKSWLFIDKCNTYICIIPGCLRLEALERTQGSFIFLSLLEVALSSYFIIDEPRATSQRILSPADHCFDQPFQPKKAVFHLRMVQGPVWKYLQEVPQAAAVPTWTLGNRPLPTLLQFTTSLSMNSPWFRLAPKCLGFENL